MYKFLYTTVAVMLLTTCGQKNNNEPTEQSVINQNQVIEDRPFSMSEYHYSDKTKWNSSNVTYVIDRIAVDSLGYVTDVDGERYTNNRLTLGVNVDGREVLKHTFTRAEISGFVDEEYMNRSIIQGLVFSEAAKDGLRFLMSVGQPLSDEYVQLRVTVDRNGGYTMRRDEIIDYNLADDDSLDIN